MTMAATSCMLPSSVAACCCSSCDVTQTPTGGALHDVIPLTDALRDVISLTSHCHLRSPPKQVNTISSSSYSLPPASPSAPPPAMGLRSPGGPTPPPSPSVKCPPSVKFFSASPSNSGCSLPPTSGEVQGPPLLKVSPKDLRYRGEGAEHIVLRVLNSGQVVRLRKTPVGGPTISKGDLVIRAEKDEEFLHNVARPILGSLLTDESRLVSLEANTVQKLKDMLGPKRPANRRHKEINNEGVACICPDAASIFITRQCPPVSSLPASSTLPSLDSCIVPSPSSSHNFTIRRSPSLRTLCEQILCTVQDDRCEGQEMAPRVNGISHEISQETKVEQNLRNSQPVLSTTNLSNATIPYMEGGLDSSHQLPHLMAEEMLGLQERGRPRVDSRNSFENLLDSREPQNICIEIKPKQGFIDTSTPGLPLCRYCVKQYIKVGKDVDQVTSQYCPLDLFSGNLTRMRKAVDGLLESPQNNLKVFVDGESVDNCLSFRDLRDVIISALTYDFSTGKAELREEGPLSPWSPLGRTLAFQTLDKLGVFNAVRLYNHLVKVIGQAKAADELLQDLKCWTGDTKFCQSSDDLCTRCSVDDTKRTNCSYKSHHENCNLSVQENGRLVIENSPEVFSDHLENYEENRIPETTSGKESMELSNRKNSSVSRSVVESSVSSSQEDIVRKLQEYLLSTTAKDLSLMILLSGPYRSTPVPSNIANSSPFVVELEPGVWFRCQVTGVDLVAKPPSKILKHEQDYMTLKAVLEDLKRHGREPACCKL